MNARSRRRPNTASWAIYSGIHPTESEQDRTAEPPPDRTATLEPQRAPPHAGPAFPPRKDAQPGRDAGLFRDEQRRDLFPVPDPATAAGRDRLARHPHSTDPRRGDQFHIGGSERVTDLRCSAHP